MPFNPSNKEDFKKLVDTMKYNQKKFEVYRDNRIKFIRQFVGMHYSDDGSGDKIPLNLLELMVNVYTSQLVSKNPQASVTAGVKQLKPAAKTLELAVNHLIDEISLGKTLKKGTTDSLFSLGIGKVGLNYSKTVEMGGFKHDVGQPFADMVQIDDFIYDLKARAWETISFAADRFRIPLEQVKDCGLYSKEAVKQIKPEKDKKYSRQENRASDITSDNADYRDEGFKDYCQIWDVWLPEENQIVTVSFDSDIPLRVNDWTGPEHGMYHLLGYTDVPGNIMPLSPISLLFDLHELTNNLYRQLGRQALRQKTITAYEGKAVKDADRIRQSPDGETVRVDNIDKVKEMKYGGADQMNIAFTTLAKQNFSYFGGNLDSIGGLGAQAETAKQEQLIAASSSQRLASMGLDVKEWAGGIMKDLAWYLWHDPLIELPVVKRVEGTDLEVTETFSPETQEGDFFDYNITINPYSMKDSTPEEQVGGVMAYLRETAPFQPQMQQQGVNIDFEALTNLVADVKNIPQMKEIITFSGTEQQEQPIGTPTPKIKNMTNKYEHSYTSQASQAGLESQVSQMAMGQAGAAQEGLQQNMLQGTA